MSDDSRLATKLESDLIEVVPRQGERGLDKPANPLMVAHSLLRGRYVLAVCLAILGAAIGAPIGYLLIKPEYKSIGMIKIQPILPKVLFETEQNGIIPMLDAFLAAQVAELRGRRVIGEAMGDPEWKALGRGLQPDKVAEFEQSLEVTNPRGSTLLQVSFTDRDPKAATIAVKSVIAAFERIFTDTESKADTQPLGILESRRLQLESEVKTNEDAIMAIATDFGSASLQEVYDFKVSELNKLESQLRYAEMQTALAGGHRTPATEPSNAPSTRPAEVLAREVQVDPKMLELQREREAESRDLRVKEMQFGKGHPYVKDLERRLTVIDQDIVARESVLLAQIKSPESDVRLPNDAETRTATLEELRANEDALRQLHSELKEETFQLGKKNLRIIKLRADAKEARERLDETKRRLEQLTLEKNVSGRLQVMSRGDVPLAPERDHRKALTAVGGLGLAGVGVGITMLLGFFDRRLKEVDTTCTHLRQIDCLLGVLPEMPGELVDPENAAAAAYCVHHIRAMLQIRQRASAHKVFAVTSPSPRDGKTSLVMTLGMSLAASGCNTLLVDCDLDGQSLTARLCRGTKGTTVETSRRNSGPIHGLFGAMRGEPLDTTIIHTGYPNLSLLPMDASVERPSGQLSPDGLRRVLDQIAPKFDAVLIDTGPILGSVEATIVATEADGIILVISRNADRSDAERAANLLISAGADIEGIVFNRAHETDVAKSVYHSSASVRSVREDNSTNGVTVQGDALIDRVQR